LIVAGLISASNLARGVDAVVGALLVGIGLLFGRNARRAAASAACRAAAEVEARERS